MSKEGKGNLVSKFNKITKIVFAFNIITQLVYICYLSYAISSNTGNIIANIVLLSISVVYFIFFLINSRKTGKEGKAAKVKNKKFRKWGKRFVKLYTLAVALYSMHVNISNFGLEEFNLLSFIVTIFMLGLWFNQVILDIVLWVVKRQISKMKSFLGSTASNMKDRFIKRKEVENVEG